MGIDGNYDGRRLMQLYLGVKTMLKRADVCGMLFHALMASAMAMAVARQWWHGRAGGVVASGKPPHGGAASQVL